VGHKYAVEYFEMRAKFQSEDQKHNTTWEMHVYGVSQQERKI